MIFRFALAVGWSSFFGSECLLRLHLYSLLGEATNYFSCEWRNYFPCVSGVLLSKDSSAPFVHHWAKCTFCVAGVLETQNLSPQSFGDTWQAVATAWGMAYISETVEGRSFLTLVAKTKWAKFKLNPLFENNNACQYGFSGCTTIHSSQR